MTKEAYQLSLFENNCPGTSRESASLRKQGDRIAHGVCQSATTRGVYWVYWYNYRSIEGVRRTKKCHIRGAAVGTVRGDRLCRDVLALIDAGFDPPAIVEWLKQLPRSFRRQRYPNWELLKE